jgi:DNA (cytosine-5)-methyltransferase 1
MNDRQRPVVSLFSGAGGLDLGFEKAGFAPLLALDVDPAAVSTYNFNRTDSIAVEADLATVGPDGIVELWETKAHGIKPMGIIGGPPCQAFSVSNVHRFADDPRAKLPLAYAEILAAFHDRYGLEFFLFENVAGLGHRPHAASLELFVEKFRAAGFPVVEQFYLDAVDYGVPQYRRRMFIAGFDVAPDAPTYAPPEPSKGPRRTVRDVLAGLPEPLLFDRRVQPTDRGLHPNHWAMNPKSKKFGNGALRPGEMIGRSFRTLAWDDPSWTVAYGHREVHVHPDKKRRLSVYEAMRLQGFPGSYQLQGNLSDQIRLVSDAVPPPLAEALAVSIADYLALARAANSHDERRGHAGQSGREGVHTVAPRSTSASAT